MKATGEGRGEGAGQGNADGGQGEGEKDKWKGEKGITRAGMTEDGSCCFLPTLLDHPRFFQCFFQ